MTHPQRQTIHGRALRETTVELHAVNGTTGRWQRLQHSACCQNLGMVEKGTKSCFCDFSCFLWRSLRKFWLPLLAASYYNFAISSFPAQFVRVGNLSFNPKPEGAGVLRNRSPSSERRRRPPSGPCPLRVKRFWLRPQAASLNRRLYAMFAPSSVAIR